jgi:hypothetical protein
MKLKNVLFIIILLFIVITPISVYAQPEENDVIIEFVKIARTELYLSIYDYNFNKIEEPLNTILFLGAKITILTDAKTMKDNAFIISRLAEKGAIFKCYLKGYQEIYGTVNDKIVLLKNDKSKIGYSKNEFMLIESEGLVKTYNNKFLNDSNNHYFVYHAIPDKYYIRVDKVGNSCYYKSEICKHYKIRKINRDTINSDIIG